MYFSLSQGGYSHTQTQDVCLHDLCLWISHSYEKYDFPGLSMKLKENKPLTLSWNVMVKREKWQWRKDWELTLTQKPSFSTMCFHQQRNSLTCTKKLSHQSLMKCCWDTTVPYLRKSVTELSLVSKFYNNCFPRVSLCHFRGRHFFIGMWNDWEIFHTQFFVLILSFTLFKAFFFFLV